MIAGNSRPAVERVNATTLAYNAAATGRDGVRAGGTTGMAKRKNGATTNKAPRGEEEASCDTAPGVT